LLGEMKTKATTEILTLRVRMTMGEDDDGGGDGVA
jgi:hypothetical protein